MPRGQDSRLKDPELHEKLRGEGASKEKAARSSNAVGRQGRSEVGRKGGESSSYEDWTVPALRRRARELGLGGYSRLRKSELVDALRDH